MEMVDNSSGQPIMNGQTDAMYGDIFYNAAPGHMNNDYRYGNNYMPPQPMMMQNPYAQNYYPPQRQQYNPYVMQRLGQPMQRPMMNPPMYQQAPPNDFTLGSIATTDANGNPINCQMVHDDLGGVRINLNQVPLPTKDGGYTNFNDYNKYDQSTGNLIGVQVGQSSPTPSPMANPALQNPALQGGYCCGGFTPYGQQPQPMRSAIKCDGSSIYDPTDTRITYVDKSVHIPGVNLTSNAPLYPKDLNEQLEKLQNEMDDEITNELAKESSNEDYCYKNKDNMYENFNYMTINNRSYGGYYYNGYYQNPTERIINAVHDKYYNKVRKIVEDAIDARKALNKRLSKMVHCGLKDDITDEEIDNIYDGREYIIPKEQVKIQNSTNYFDSLVELTEDQIKDIYCRPIWEEDAKISQIDKIVRENNLYGIMELAENRYHAAKKDNLLFNSSTYERVLIRRKMERLKEDEEKQGIQRIHKSDIDLYKASKLPGINTSLPIDTEDELTKRLNESRVNPNSLLYGNRPMQMEQFIKGDQPLSEYVKPSENNPDQTHMVKRNIPFAEEFPTLNECSTINEKGQLEIHVPDYILNRQKKESESPPLPENDPFYDSIWHESDADRLVDKAKRGG